MTEWMDMVQWPAFAASVMAAWMIGSRSPSRRYIGFWIFLASNVLWVIWGVHIHAIALVALQCCLAAMNLRGVKKTDQQEE